MIYARTTQFQPSLEVFIERLSKAKAKGRPFVAKYGIDPTGSEIHVGHAVPMLLLSRLQRMGHRIVFIIGDITAKIGDPSGRSDERPPLTDSDIAHNLSTYKEQAAPFFDFDNAEFRHNSDWLSEVRLPHLLDLAAKIPISMSLQRDDFRKRLDAGHGLSLAEVLYSVAMGLDSVELNCDIEVGGIDQFLNMQMCRKLMDISGQVSEIVAVTDLIEGTDGTGSKMSKSKNNYIPVAAEPTEIFGKLMSIPDKLIKPYLKALTEWHDSEVDLVMERINAGSAHPMDIKKILAGDVTAAVHGPLAAEAARNDFNNKFSKRSFSEVEDLPSIGALETAIIDVLTDLKFCKSKSEARRLAQQKGLRLVFEQSENQKQVIIAAEELSSSLTAILEKAGEKNCNNCFLKAGRRIARIVL